MLKENAKTTANLPTALIHKRTNNVINGDRWRPKNNRRTPDRFYVHHWFICDGYEVNGRQQHFSITVSSHWSGCGGSSEAAGGIGSTGGRCLWNASTAAATPSSFSISLANSIVRDLTSGSSIYLIAIESRSTLSSYMGIGLGPTPLAWILSPQKNWSPKKGIIVVGHPALNPEAVVPAPPWWTTAAHRGNNQSWGQSSRRKTSAGTSERIPRSPQPRPIIPLCPVSFSASKIILVVFLASCYQTQCI